MRFSVGDLMNDETRNMQPAERMTLIYWISFLDLAYRYPGASMLLKSIFLLEAQRKLTEDLLEGFDVQLRKLKEEVAAMETFTTKLSKEST